MGRKTTYTEAVAEQIAERIASGEPLADICRDPKMPKLRTVYDWAEAHPEFAASIARARKDGFDAIACRARRTTRGKTEDEGGDSTGDVQRDKLIVETDLKLLAKWDPKGYGERVQVDAQHGLSEEMQAWLDQRA